MDARALARWMVLGSNTLLAASLLLLLVWWDVSVPLFVAGWLLYGVAYLLARGTVQEHAVLATREG